MFRRTCTKFHQDSLKTKRQVCFETDRQTDVDSARRNDQEYIYFKGSDTPSLMRYKLRDKIIISSARVYKCSKLRWSKLDSRRYCTF